MGFKKLALAAAVAAAPMSALALEPMQDDALSSVTGQDGISIGLSLNATLDLGIEDTDGFAGGPANPGMILIDDMGLSGDISILIDSASSASGSGVLQANISIPTLTLDTGDIYVGEGTDGTDVAAGIAKVGSELTAVSAGDPLIDSVGITLNDVNLAVQLGSDAANFFALSSSTTLTIDIGTLGDYGTATTDANDNFVLRDQSAGGGGAMVADQISIRNVDVNGITGTITNAGLAIATNAALSDVQVAAMGVAFGADDGSAASIGNVYITGLDLSGQTITISGH
ncbi:hypothetical protein A15D_02798 [Alcanivorax sp. MD8A]|uniref:DUF6160 family protein n=1 Tax=Alcanivorax sp. MD8A TaxID=1177157 RepID=UPI000C9B6856|nr:DUF6160 family protein [Alcanivorax sp. MD8A]PNE01652.1 hypothetical protein A15D_02798 [Alcanivorax sp. MD8A]